MSDTEEFSTAKAPFDNPEGDIILQSADGVDFHVFKLILSLASDVFQGMFTLPQETMQSGGSSTPIIPMTEDSTTLESLLLLCYPTANPIFKTLEDAKDVLEAARKYGMEAPISRARDIIFTRFLETKPLELYALSCAFGWQQHAQNAATLTLQISLKDLGRPDSNFLGIKDMSAFDYHKLLIYHHDCGVAAQAVGKSLTWLQSPFDEMCMWKCASARRKKYDTVCKGIGRKVDVADLGELLITPWFDEYLASSGKELYARPCESTIWTLDARVTYDRAIQKAMGCSYCGRRVIEHMEYFRTLYAARVKNALTKVRRSLPTSKCA